MLLDIVNKTIDGGVVVNWDAEFLKPRKLILVRSSSGPMKSRACEYWVQRVPQVWIRQTLRELVLGPEERL